MLLDRVGCFGERREIHDLRFDHVASGEPLDALIDRRAKQQRLPFFGALPQDFFDVGPKADVEHAVGFVEHDAL